MHFLTEVLNAGDQLHRLSPIKAMLFKYKETERDFSLSGPSALWCGYVSDRECQTSIRRSYVINPPALWIGDLSLDLSILNANDYKKLVDKLRVLYNPLFEAVDEEKLSASLRQTEKEIAGREAAQNAKENKLGIVAKLAESLC